MMVRLGVAFLLLVALAGCANTPGASPNFSGAYVGASGGLASGDAAMATSGR